MKQVESAHLPIGAGSHPGMTGKNNEDRYKVSAYHLDDQRKTPVVLAVLSDGIGGHQAGEIAAQMAVDIFTDQVGAAGSPTPQVIHSAAARANQEIYQLAISEANRRGMGATLSMACIVGNRLYTGTVGDSRIYLMRAGTIQQISTDHTWIQEALERGVLTQDQVKGHPNAHVIRRYLGAPTPPEVDFRIRLNPEENDARAVGNQGTRLKTGDRLLLCSDGLSDLVEAPEILAAFESRTLDEAVQYLTDLANERGGHDNITIVVMEIPPGKLNGNNPVSWRLVAIISAILLVILVVTGVLVWMFMNSPNGGSGGVATRLPLPTLPLPTIPPTLAPMPVQTDTLQPATNTPLPTLTSTPIPSAPAQDLLPSTTLVGGTALSTTSTPFPNKPAALETGSGAFSPLTPVAPGTLVPVTITATRLIPSVTPTQGMITLTPIPTKN